MYVNVYVRVCAHVRSCLKAIECIREREAAWLAGLPTFVNCASEAPAQGCGLPGWSCLAGACLAGACLSMGTSHMITQPRLVCLLWGASGTCCTPTHACDLTHCNRSSQGLRWAPHTHLGMRSGRPGSVRGRAS